MRELNPIRLCEHVDIDASVSSWSTIYVKENVYSVPSHLIGQQVRVRVRERDIEVWFVGRCELNAERLQGMLMCTVFAPIWLFFRCNLAVFVLHLYTLFAPRGAANRDTEGLC
jgi:hypothetical protein